ncbi:MAG: cardiolipin synthase B, partial [Burkholderiales bacterium]|nr:cardiolipin synthase B [Burkholderiales bacterium]
MASKRTKARVAIAVGSVLSAALLVLLGLNLSMGEDQIEYRLEHLYGVDDPQFLRSMSVLLGPPVVDGNVVEELLNGQEIFPAMLQAIRGAKKTVNFETYIYWSGAIGREFTDAVSDRAAAGVKV